MEIPLNMNTMQVLWIHPDRFHGSYTETQICIPQTFKGQASVGHLLCTL